MNHSKIPKLLIKQLLIRDVLTQFYASFIQYKGEGFIYNTVGGAMIYDILKDDIEIDIDTKKQLWSISKSVSKFRKNITPEHYQKKELEDIYKSKIVEWHLNKLALDGKVLEI